MSIMESSYCGSIWHHGIKGQKWGVRRTPEQLGHKPKGSSDLAISKESATIENGYYHSAKGFRIAVAKLARFCLDPEKKHAKEFFDVGYQPSDSDLLFRHIEEGFDMGRKIGERKSEMGDDQFCIPMKLGVTEKRMFSTAWQIDKGALEPKLVTAYLDRRVKEGK